MFRIKRTYEAPARGDGRRILVERLWPRGMKKGALAADAWMKDVAPSTELRRWFGHRVERWAEFGVEHWVVAQRQGQTAARNILGRRERFDAVPFFWTEQYDFGLAYVGHAERWDKAELEGTLDLETRDCTVTYSRGGKSLASAFVHRDLDGLRAEVEFERAGQPRG